MESMQYDPQNMDNMTNALHGIISKHTDPESSSGDADVSKGWGNLKKVADILREDVKILAPQDRQAILLGLME